MKPHNDTIEALRLFGLTSLRNEQIKPIEALRKCNGNRTAAAKLLGISRRTLHRKLAR